MRVLAVDPGTAIVGYGIIEYISSKYSVLDYGCIYTDKSMDMPERLAKIYQELETLINLYKPDTAAVEELFFFKNNKTIISVGQARGVILLAFSRNNIKTYGYTPLQVKQGVAGYGRADKKQVQEITARILGLSEIPKPDDAADALALAFTHINTISSGLNQTLPSGKASIDTSRIKGTKRMSVEEYRKIK